MVKKITGKVLCRKWNINAEHALYREDGKWYHHLMRFPGVLFDKNGYIVFLSKDQYLTNPYLVHGLELHVPKGISSIPGYTKI